MKKLSDNYIYINTQRGVAFLNSDFDYKEIHDIVNKPELLFENAKIYKDSRTTKAGVAEIKFNGKSEEVFLKSFNNKGFIYTIRYIFREPRPYRVIRAAEAIKSVGVSTPQPIAGIVDKKFGVIPENAYLLRESVNGIISTLDYFKIMLDNEELVVEYLDSVLAMFAKLHKSGIFHGDSKCSNVYVCKNENGSYHYGIWDLLSCQIGSTPVSQRLRDQEIARFANSFAEIAKRLEKPLPKEGELDNIFVRYYKK